MTKMFLSFKTTPTRADMQPRQKHWCIRACKLAVQRGHEGNVSFFSKTQLVQHYIDTLGAMHIGGRIIIIDTIAALKLINKYFPNEK